MAIRDISKRLAFAGLCQLLAAAAIAAPAFYPAQPDPGFNGGLFFVDRFARPADHNFTAERLVRLAGGDVVAAGRVSLPVPLQPGASMYLGLVRYNAAGQRMPWGSGADTNYTHYNRQYIVYPKGSAPPYTRVVDIVSYGAFLYVMAEGPASVGGTQRTVQVVVFRESDGEFVGIHNAFARAEDEWGAGLVPVDAGFAGSYLLAVGTKVSASGVLRPTFRRFRLQFGTGALTLDTSIAPASDGYRDVVFPNAGFCDSGACSGSAHAVAWYGGGVLPMGIYVGGSLLLDNGGTDYLVLRVGADGAPDTTFNGSGLARVDIVTPNDYPQEYLYDIAVRPRAVFDPRQDEIFAVGGTGASWLVKLRGDGSRDTRFGDAQSGFVQAGIRSPRAMVLRGDDVIIAGQDRVYSAALNRDLPEASISVVEQNVSGGLSYSMWINALPATDAAGTRYGDSAFKDLVVVPGGVVATGDVVDAAAGTVMFGTLGVRSDEAFADGFE